MTINYVFDKQLLGGGVIAVFIHLQLTQVYFVATVLVTDLVVASTFLLIIAGCLLVVAAPVGFIAVAIKRPPAIATVRRDVILVLVLVVLLLPFAFVVDDTYMYM